MLSSADVAQIAREEGLEAFAEELSAYARPGWHLLAGGADRPAASKVGGDPDLGEGERWPLNRRGVPMAFVAQIDTSGLPAFDPPWKLAAPWKHNGQLVRFFADLLDNPIASGPALALTTDPAGALTRTPAPPVPDHYPLGGRCDHHEPRDDLYRLPETVVRVHPFLTAPETPRPCAPRGSTTTPTPTATTNGRRGYASTARRTARRSPYELQHLLGEPISIEDDVRHTGVMFNAPTGTGRLSRAARRILT